MGAAESTRHRHDVDKLCVSRSTLSTQPKGMLGEGAQLIAVFDAEVSSVGAHLAAKADVPGAASNGASRPSNPLRADLGSFLAAHEAELIDFRRDMHAHPELGYHEHRATRRITLRLAAAGLRPMILPKGTGLIADIGDNSDGSPLVALRADLDALPLSDEKQVSYRSTVPNACHACGHDVHTTIAMGAGLFLAQQAAAGRCRDGCG